MPEAAIYVFDNASTDGTAEVARGAGATVMNVTHRGKGNVVRRMFADVDADIYILADGDGTYDPGAARQMIDATAGRRARHGGRLPGRLGRAANIASDINSATGR